MPIADASTLKGIPEMFETEAGESLIARTESLATFRELGPPDLCRIDKFNPKSNGAKEINSYHFVLGVDSSSSASVAAYLNSLSYALVSPNPKTPNPWKIRSGTYCCFNAFSRVDVRVEVRIPGGVESYIVDLRGDKHRITNAAVWQETYVSAVLRSLLDDNDEPDGNDGNPILGLRKMDPLDTLGAEKRFLEAAAAEFWKGWQLGTNPEVQIATYFSNHLTNGIMKYFKEGGRLDQAAKFFDSLFAKDAEVGAVLAPSYFGNHDEIKGVLVLHEALKKNSASYGLLLAQVDFLISKKNLELAAKIAKLGVVAAPSEYVTWAKLTEVYIQLGDFESALLALNSCPMFSYCERDSQRMPVPARIHLPLRPDQKDDQASNSNANHSGSIEDENDPRENQIHPELARLPALSLRGTFLLAYKLLIQIVSKVGWDELLKFRSKVFVMEEEYRIHRALVEESQKEAQIVKDDEERESADARSTEKELPATKNHAEEPVQRLVKAQVAVNGVVEPEDADVEEDNTSIQEQEKKSNTNERDKSSSPRKGESRLEELERENFESIRLTPEPEVLLTPGEDGKRGLSIDEMLRRASGDAKALGDDEDKNAEAGIDSMGSVEGHRELTSTPNPRPKRTPINFTFRNKRLCEKWLDNLFMVLYNDLRLYTALKQEMVQHNLPGSKPQALYRKTGAEWEVYGDLAERLHHPEEAKIAYKLCIEQKFSIKAWLKVLAMEADEGNTREALIAVNKVIVLLDKSYIDNTYPSPLGRAIFQLIGRHGYQKVHNVLIALNIPSRNFKLIMKFFEYATLFKVAGHDL
ncbi:hypothetical protein HDU81_007605 [Chytriomyces hyalinus]|nr:hypothetical protein HDU81_007605 [Chytriomyces hyalinus]